MDRSERRVAHDGTLQLAAIGEEYKKAKAKVLSSPAASPAIGAKLQF